MLSSQRSEFSFPSVDGIHQVHAVQWLPEDGQPKAVLQILHGISEHIGRYDTFARFLTAHGYAVIGSDHLGHGKTATGREEFGYLSDQGGCFQLLKDARTMRLKGEQLFPGLPYYLFGHSMGSYLARGYLMDYPGTVDGCLLTGTGHETARIIALGNAFCPFLRKLKGGNLENSILNFFSAGMYNAHFKPVRTNVDWFTRDTAELDAYLNDPLCHFMPTIAMFCDIFEGLAYLSDPANLKRMCSDTPVFLFSGENDPVGHMGKAVKWVYDMLKRYGVKEVTLKLYPEARHELLHELNRGEVYNDVLDWLETHRKALLASYSVLAAAQ